MGGLRRFRTHAETGRSGCLEGRNIINANKKEYEKDFNVAFVSVHADRFGTGCYC